MRQALAATKLHRASKGVTLTPGEIDRVSEIVSIKIPKGLGIFVPGTFPLLLKLSGAVHSDAEIYWGFRTPADPRRTIGIGNTLMYQVFKDLTPTEQQHRDYRDAVTVNLGMVPGLALVEDETFVISLWTPSGTAATADTRFQIPYYEGKPGDVVSELELRRILHGS